MPEPFDAPYMQRALLAGLLLAVPLGVLGAWVVLRGLAFFAHAVGVATFPGVVVGLALPAVGPLVGALAAAGVFTAAVGGLEADHRVRGGAATAVALSTALALGAVLLTGPLGATAPVESVLFGSLLAITAADVLRCGVVALVSLVALGLALRPLAAATFDREWATASGARPRQGDVVVLALVAVVVVSALPAVGSLLVSGLLVVPAASVRLLTERLAPLMAGAALLCAAETALGLGVAAALDLPPGASIATVSGIAFACAGAMAALRGRIGPLNRSRASEPEVAAAR